MKIVRNPKTGILEVFDDKGKKIGEISAMGDVVDK